MSGKERRGREKGGKKPAARKKPAAASRAKGRSPSKSPTKSPTKKETAPVTLPAYGLAEDVLGGAAAKAAGSGEERIYDFAAALEAEDARRLEEAPARPQRLETWVTFGLGDETYGLPVAPVQEVLRVTGITRVPHAPRPIRGVTQVRGRVIPVVDLGLRLGLEPRTIDRASRILVVASRGHRLGLLVDRVDQVVHLDLEQAQAPPEDVVTVESDYISAVYHLEDQLILLLDVDRVLIVHEVSGAA
ncbi:MAG: chemotaxis protein CheW [Acidobacteria bacterium]|nr:MAG: chemotaxis protein CheW [Acidobacteriota bacterium]